MLSLPQASHRHLGRLLGARTQSPGNHGTHEALSSRSCPLAWQSRAPISFWLVRPARHWGPGGGVPPTPPPGHVGLHKHGVRSRGRTETRTHSSFWKKLPVPIMSSSPWGCGWVGLWFILRFIYSEVSEDTVLCECTRRCAPLPAPAHGSYPPAGHRPWGSPGDSPVDAPGGGARTWPAEARQPWLWDLDTWSACTRSQDAAGLVGFGGWVLDHLVDHSFTACRVAGSRGSLHYV